MKIIQLNTWQGRITEPLLNFIKTTVPDILLTQEIFSYPAPVSPDSPWKQFSLLEQIATQNHFDHVFFSPSGYLTLFGQKVGYGNAVFSKYAFNHTSTHYTGGPGPAQFDNPNIYDNNAGRNFQHVRINTGKTTLNLINHHGHWVDQPRGDAVSLERLQQVADYIATLTDPVILGGDFNLSPDSAPVQALQHTLKLHDLVADAHPSSTLSAAHYVGINIICDYLLASPSLKVKSIQISEKIVSDHKAVIAEIDC
jgi:endonuclease/exonuclease/phosphatase family metal-dependent hydrolase